MTDSLPQKSLTVPLPANETERLAALHRYKILDTPPEAAFDRITTLAARLFNIPTALISLVDESRAWFKSCIGFDAREVPRDVTLCSFSVLTDEPLIIPDTRLDDRFACNPFVQSEPGVRFYAGAPLLSRDGFSLGTLCLLDTQPHQPLTAEQQATLVDLAAMVVDELELRLAAHKVAQSEEKYRTLFESIDEGFCICEMLFDENGKPYDYRFLEVNPVFALLTGLEEAGGKTARELVPNLENHWVEIYGSVVQTGEPIRFEQQSIAMNRWFNVNAFCINEPQNHQFALLFTEISDRVRAEEERKQAEITLRASEQQLRAIYEGTHEYIGLLTPDGTLLEANRASLEFSDIQPDQVIGLPFWETVWFQYTPNAPEAVRQAVVRAAAGEFVRFEAPIVNPAGETMTFDLSFYPICNETGEVILILPEGRDITDLKQAEANLREAHVQLESALAAGAIYTWRWNIPIDRVVVNAAFAHLFGVDAVGATTAGLPIEFFINSMHEEDRPRVAAAIQQAIATGEVFTAEYRVKSATGEERWVTARGQVEYDAAGLPIAFPGALADITERKQAEAALHESEERFRLMADAFPQIVWLTDAEGRVEFFNKQWSNYTGIPYEPTTAAEIAANFVHPDDGAMTMEAFNEARRIGSAFAVEHRIRSAAGAYRWFLVRAEPYREPQTGEIIRWFGASLDIHDRKQAEAALQESEEQSRNILESVTDAFFALDENWRFTYVNGAAETLLARTLGNLIGQNIWEAYPGLDASEFEQLYWRVMRDRVAGSVTAFYPDHDRWYEVHVYPGTNGITIYFRNVTAQIQAEAALRQTSAELERQLRKFDAITASVPDFIYTFDLSGRFTYTNQPLLDLWQKTLGESLGKNFFDLEYPTDLATRLQNQIQQVIETR